MNNSKSPTIISGNAKVVRSINRSTVLNLIRTNQPISRVAISRISGLNKSTVSSIVSELIDDQLVSEEEEKDQNVGRNPILLRLKSEYHFVGAINIDSAACRIAIIDIGGKLLEKTKIATNREDPKTTILHCLHELQQLQQKSGISNLKGLGISISGIVHSESGVLVLAPNLNWRNINLAKILNEQNLDIEIIIIENDAKASALAELWFGIGPVKSYDDFVFLTIGVGIGAGIVVNNKVFDGSNHSAGEFGHMTIIEGGKRCSCGNYGCLETYASDRATVAGYNKKRSTNAGSSPFSETLLDNVVQKAFGQDQDAVDALRESAKHIGIGIVNIVKAVDPQAVIIGGKITKAWDIIQPVILTILKEKNIFGLEREIDVLPSSLSIRPRLLGAATCVIRNLFHDYQITK